ncbi:MAG TPA: hypothetical protein VMF91_04195 [Bryobacteraceae bacterium]|nr:hypothetical protein [Bryobacteraceae bacterium]
MIPPSDPGGPDKMATIEGVVANSCENCRVILFAHGDVWYVQPYAANPSTAIRADGTWRNQTHLGTEYAALVVTQGYDPPPTSPELPEVGGKIVASTVVEGRR